MPVLICGKYLCKRVTGSQQLERESNPIKATHEALSFFIYNAGAEGSPVIFFSAFIRSLAVHILKLSFLSSCAHPHYKHSPVIHGLKKGI